MRPFAVVAVFVLLLLADSGTGFAHRLNLFAYADGATIVGSAYFSGGGVPEGAAVVAYGADDRVLGRTTTAADGTFSLEATARADHRLTIETADGHAAAFIVRAGELPATGRLAAAVPSDGVGASAVIAAEPPPALPAGLDAAALDAAVARAVQQQIQPLRQELAAATAETRLRDIIGGIGYILGLFGIAAYLFALKRNAATERRGRSTEAATAE